MTDHWTSLLTTRLIAASLVVAVAGTGHAFFIAANTQPQKNRADISVQSSKYMACREGARGLREDRHDGRPGVLPRDRHGIAGVDPDGIDAPDGW